MEFCSWASLCYGTCIPDSTLEDRHSTEGKSENASFCKSRSFQTVVRQNSEFRSDLVDIEQMLALLVAKLNKKILSDLSNWKVWASILPVSFKSNLQRACASFCCTRPIASLRVLRVVYHFTLCSCFVVDLERETASWVPTLLHTFYLNLWHTIIVVDLECECGVVLGERVVANSDVHYSDWLEKEVDYPVLLKMIHENLGFSIVKPYAGIIDQLDVAEVGTELSRAWS